jgi:hypothetical protein
MQRGWVSVTALALIAGAAVGCAGGKPAVQAPTTNLGRIVVYRNGVAYFERFAEVNDDFLTLQVPAERVDDFLKSLTVTDANTGEPAPIAYPRIPPGETGTVAMKIRLLGEKPHKLKLSYVTEAPAWKSSYRVAVLDKGKVELQAWALVDNNSAEDWENVRLGVGSSSALSFRYDLRSLREVSRETLHSNELFAAAPPTGGSSYGSETSGSRTARNVVGELSDAALAMAEEKEADTQATASTRHQVRPVSPSKAEEPYAPPARVTPGQAAMGAAGHSFGRGGGSGQSPIAHLGSRLKHSNHPIVVEGYANADDKDKMTASLNRANRMRERLLRDGVDPKRIVAIGKGAVAGRNGGVQVVEQPLPPPPAEPKKPASATDPSAADPIGTAHFESQNVTTVHKNSSAMVSVLKATTAGDMVYLYDAESARGNKQYAFRAIRLENPTTSVLESGPFTVFGKDRFIGEGLAEPIAAKSTAFIPFALDRQVVVETNETSRDEIDRIITVQRGVFSTETQHTRKTAYTLFNRNTEKSPVFLKHSVWSGYKLSKSPDRFEKVNGSYLFRVDLEPNQKLDVVIEEQTPIFKTTDIRTPGGLEMVSAYLSSRASNLLKGKIAELVGKQREMADVDQRIATKREQMDEYRQRMDELHAQVFTLRAVKAGNTLMRELERKLAQMSEKLSKATVEVVDLQEKLMVARIDFQTKIAELTLENDESKKMASQ